MGSVAAAIAAHLGARVIGISDAKGAILDTGAPVSPSVDELAWSGPRPQFEDLASALGAPDLARRAGELAG